MFSSAKAEIFISQMINLHARNIFYKYNIFRIDILLRAWYFLFLKNKKRALKIMQFYAKHAYSPTSSRISDYEINKIPFDNSIPIWMFGFLY